MYSTNNMRELIESAMTEHDNTGLVHELIFDKAIALLDTMLSNPDISLNPDLDPDPNSWMLNELVMYVLMQLQGGTWRNDVAYRWLDRIVCERVNTWIADSHTEHDSDSDSENEEETEEIPIFPVETESEQEIYDFLPNLLGRDVLELALYAPCDRAVKLLPGARTSHNTQVTSSSGTNATIIPIDLPYVLQAFASPEVYHRVQQFWMRAEGTAGLAEILAFHDDLMVIAVEKVIPIADMIPSPLPDNIDLIYAQISQTIYDLGHKGLVHGDPRLDNIGWSETKSRYLLFDYDGGKIAATHEQTSEDLRALEISISYHVDEV